MPQFLTAGHAIWKPGQQHFSRRFHVYDLLYVCAGTLYMNEGGEAYEISPGTLLLLEPDLTHCGYRPCEEPTEIYWVHFSHQRPLERLPDKQAAWSVAVREGTDHDLAPVEQYLYLPKFGPANRLALQPLFEEMLRLRKGLTMEHAFDLQLLLGRLLSLLQAGLRGARKESRSRQVAEQVKRYVETLKDAAFDAGRMEEALHYDSDYAARCLRRHTGMSPLQYHHLVRMEEAKRLLGGTALTVREVAGQVGFADYNYFIRVFRRSCGMTPGAYRKSAAGLV